MLQPDRTRQPQLEERFGEGRDGHALRNGDLFHKRKGTRACARGHVGMGAWGQGAHTRGPEAQRLGGTEENLRVSGLGHRELAPGFRRLKAEGLTPERLTTVAVTRHLELIMPETLIPVSGFPLSSVAASSGLRSRPSGIRYGSSGSGTGAGPEPVPGAEHLNPGPDG